MDFLQAKFRGKKFSDFQLYIDGLDIEGGWIVHYFTLMSMTNKPLYYFQLYNDTNGALILVKTHRRIIKSNNYLDMEIIDFFAFDKFICDKVHTKTVGRVANAYSISSFFIHIENILIS